MILVSAVDYNRKYGKMSFLKKNHKKSFYAKIQGFGVFFKSARGV